MNVVSEVFFCVFRLCINKIKTTFNLTRRTMKIDRIALLTLSFFFMIAGCAEQAQDAAAPADMEEAVAAAEPVAWSYEGETGPDAWGTFNPDHSACSAGVEQSPIALVETDAQTEELPALSFSYGEANFNIEDTGYGYKASPDGEHMLTVGDDTYKLLQLHGHTPSEHTLNGESFPMAVHFVHQNDAGDLAVVGVLIASGEVNMAYNVYAGGDAAPVSLLDMLPADHSYLTYPGSLTTPPCSEGVRWIVLKEPVTMSPEQIDYFASAHGNTNRPVQPLGERIIRMAE